MGLSQWSISGLDTLGGFSEVLVLRVLNFQVVPLSNPLRRFVERQKDLTNFQGDIAHS